MGKFELHVHTRENDIYARLGGAEIVRLYHDIGYEGLVITDHYFSLFYEWFSEEMNLNNHASIIDRWLRGYREAKAEGDRLGISVLLGAEVRFDGPVINDYLIYGITEEFLYSAPLLNSLKNLDELVAILPDTARVVLAHPFRNGMTVVDPSPLFGIEVYNGNTPEIRNRIARIWAKDAGKVMTSGSDFHSRKSLARGGIQTERSIRTSADLISVLEDGCFTPIEIY